MYELKPWSIRTALPPFLAFLFALIYALYILSYPPWHRKLAMIPYALLLYYAFVHHLALTPWYTTSDTFGRFTYIWFFHISNLVTIIEYSPCALKENLGWRSRLRQAYKVLFQIDVQDANTNAKPAREHHGYTRLQFTLYHALWALLYYAAMQTWDYYALHLSPAHFLPRASRASLAVHTFELFFEWIFHSLFQYEAIHSVFAALLVGILRLDSPAEWRLSLCNSITEAWSVRRYWGKHWHRYIYSSFTAHAKVITRGWCGMSRGRLDTRLVENTAVFAMSGLAHAAVRWAQDKGTDYWAIAIWYTAQMVPIVVEGVVQDIWRGARRKWGIKRDDQKVNVAEKIVGYVWTTAWFCWSLTVYSRTRDRWARDKRMRMFEKQWAMWEEQTVVNVTGGEEEVVAGS